MKLPVLWFVAPTFHPHDDVERKNVWNVGKIQISKLLCNPKDSHLHVNDEVVFFK
jgi:hypothetical protein